MRARCRGEGPAPIGPPGFQPASGDVVVINSTESPLVLQARKRGVPGQVPARLKRGFRKRNNSASRASAARSSAHS
jgi:hypothetical protein